MAWRWKIVSWIYEGRKYIRGGEIAYRKLRLWLFRCLWRWLNVRFRRSYWLVIIRSRIDWLIILSRRGRKSWSRWWERGRVDWIGWKCRGWVNVQGVKAIEGSRCMINRFRRHEVGRKGINFRDLWGRSGQKSISVWGRRIQLILLREIVALPKIVKKVKR